MNKYYYNFIIIFLILNVLFIIIYHIVKYYNLIKYQKQLKNTYNDIKNNLKTGDVISIRKTKFKNLINNVKNKFRFTLGRFYYYHTFIILKEEDRLYGVDFVHSNYYIPSYMCNTKEKYRIFDLEFFLQEYDYMHKPILYYQPIKKEIDNNVLLKNLRTFKNYKFISVNKTASLWIVNNIGLTNIKIINDNETVCTAFVIQLLEKCKAIKLKRKLYFPNEIAHFLMNSEYFDKFIIFKYQ